MKKAFAVFLSLALVGSAAFAQEKIGEFLSISSWGRVLWDVAGTDEDGDVITGMHQSWGGAAPRTAITAVGETDVVTYMLDVFADGTDLGVGDNAYIDIRPFAGLNIPFQVSWLMGKDDMNEARRDSTYGLWGWDRVGSVNKESMEGFIFDDLLDVGVGTSLRMYFLDGLGIGRLTVAAALSLTDWDVASTGGDEDSWKTLDYAWGNGNYYLSYALPAIGANSIGTISVGYDSRMSEDDSYDPWGVINAAFEFTMVDNLYIGIGGKIATAQQASANTDAGDAHQVNLYARYGFDGMGLPLNLHVLFGSKIMAWDSTRDNNNGFGFQVGLGVDYEVIENVPIFLDVRYANGVYMDNRSDDFGENDCWTVGVGISKKWANAEIGVAFAMATNGYDPTSSHGNDDGDLTWAVPIKFEYSF